MDFAALRQEGIRQLERLTGEQWTDFNVHDPGITILEQLCYALTDLGYRAGFEIPDLLADGGADPYKDLHPPARILTCRPVTLADLRRLILDVEGVENAWIEPFEDEALSLEIDPSPTEPVRLMGLYRVSIARAEGHAKGRVLEDVARRLHENRSLCEDFAVIKVLGEQPIQIDATVEIGPSEDAARVQDEIVQRIAQAISPPVPFATLDELLEAGRTLDEIFDGPLLDHGFITDEVLARATRRTAINASDLVRAIRDVPGVRAVSRLRLSGDGRERADTSKEWVTWSQAVWDEHVARLDGGGFRITLTRAGKQLSTGSFDASPQAHRTGGSGGNVPALPAARDRNVGRYVSVQRHFPAVYGIGELGLPGSASPLRKARARQLKAYLMFFDQLMADYLAQLAHVKDLFSHEGPGARTYFMQAVDEPGLGLEVIRGPDEQHAALLESLATRPEDIERRRRFFNHLLARFSEVLDDHGSAPALLRDYPRLSGARGTAFDYLAWEGEPGRSGLEERLRVKLGLGEEKVFFLVEHILLRPVEGDNAQQRPLLSAAERRDPYSLQVTFVFPGAGATDDFKRLVEQTIRAETPAHLTAYVRWMSDDDWTSFVAARAAWVVKLREHSVQKLSAMTNPEHIPLRSARDRLIDILGIGETYPLEDMAVRGEDLTVSFEQPSAFYIEPGQEDVLYELYEGDEPVRRDEGDPASTVCSVIGGGTDRPLTGPIITRDRTFTIRASKLRSPERWRYLAGTVTVKVGLNTRLRAWIPDLPPLNPGPTRPSDTAPRIADHGSVVEVRIAGAQAGAHYELVYPGPGGVVISTEPELGTGAELSLRTQPVEEDTTIRIRVSRRFGSPEFGPDLEGWLEAELPLAVRADPALDVAIEGSSLVDPQGDVTLTIAHSQSSVVYSAYVRTLRDADFEAPAGAEVLEVTVPANPTLRVPRREVRVSKPPRPRIWEVQEGYAQQGASKQGNGDLLRLTIGRLHEDSVIVLQAHKHHPTTTAEHPAWRPGESALQLEQAAVALSRPNPPDLLTLTVSPSADATTTRMLVTGGQPGVFYHFFQGGEAIGLPAYFHRLDETDPEQNRGLGQLRVEVDFVIVRDPPRVGAEEDLARLRPLPPLVDVTLSQDAPVSVWAVKVRTGVAWEAPRAVMITTP